MFKPPSKPANRSAWFVTVRSRRDDGNNDDVYFLAGRRTSADLQLATVLELVQQVSPALSSVQSPRKDVSEGIGRQQISGERNVNVIKRLERPPKPYERFL